MTLHAVGTNTHRLTPNEREKLKAPLAQLGLTDVQQLGGAQVIAALALDVASSIPGETVRLLAALARFKQEKKSPHD